MSDGRVPGLLVTGTAVMITTTVRATVAVIGAAVAHGSSLSRLVIEASGRGQERDVATMALRDELIGLMRDTAEAQWHALRRGIDVFDALTRSSVAEGAGGNRRRHRVKR